MFGRRRPLVHVLPLSGVISSPHGLCIRNLKGMIDKAFSGKPSLVALEIDSPGGSPVESQLIAQYIIAKSLDERIPIASYIKDIAASGGYWLAIASSPRVFASAMSIVGSIGVVSAGFGFNRLIEQIGIDRRVITTGEKKVLNDPYQPRTPAGDEEITRLQKGIYECFVATVKAHRGDSLKTDQGELFDGSVWTGREAVDLGLIDGIYFDMASHLRQCLFGDVIPKIVYVNPEGTWWKKFTPAAISGLIESGISTHLMRSHYGI